MSGKTFVTLLGSAAVAGVLAAPAFAQSPIGDLLASAEQTGGTVEIGSTVSSGGVTEYSDIVASGPDGEMVISIPWLKETDLGGGVIEVTLAPVVDVTLSEDGDELGKVQISNDGLAYRVETAGADTRHTFAADMISAQRVSGDILQELDFSLTAVAGFYALQMGEIVDGSGAVSAEAARVNYAFELPDAMSKTDYVIDGMDLSWAFSGPVADPDELESFAPYSGALKFLAGAASGTASMGEGSEIMDIAFSGGESVTDVTLADGVFNYTAEAGQFAYNISAAAMGFPPVDLSANSIAMRMVAPVTVLNQHETANIAINFAGLTIGEGLWNMFDPQASLPRDPINLVIDLATDMRWLVEPPQAERFPGMPVDISRVDVNDITIQAMGAEILAAGGAAVDMTAGPVPAADGAVTVEINGLMDLTQKLSGLGLLPPEVVMGARGMIGAFATPTGPDNFRSEIVFTPDGMISANGIPLPIR